jgi:hypothetical protein
MKTKAKNLDQARYQAISLLGSLATVFEAESAWLARAIDATSKLYVATLEEHGKGTNAVGHFARGFLNVLATVEHDMTPAPQAMALAA